MERERERERESPGLSTSMDILTPGLVPSNVLLQSKWKDYCCLHSVLLLHLLGLDRIPVIPFSGSGLLIKKK